MTSQRTSKTTTPAFEPLEKSIKLKTLRIFVFVFVFVSVFFFVCLFFFSEKSGQTVRFFFKLAVDNCSHQIREQHNLNECNIPH